MKSMHEAPRLRMVSRATGAAPPWTGCPAKRSCATDLAAFQTFVKPEVVAAGGMRVRPARPAAAKSKLAAKSNGLNDMSLKGLKTGESVSFCRVSPGIGQDARVVGASNHPDLGRRSGKPKQAEWI